MEARVVVPATSTLLVVAVGMAAGHLLMPTRPTASLAARALFALAVVGSGALAGWRIGRVFRRVDGAGGDAPAAAGGAVAASILAWLAWLVVHG